MDQNSIHFISNKASDETSDDDSSYDSDSHDSYLSSSDDSLLSPVQSDAEVDNSNDAVEEVLFNRKRGGNDSILEPDDFDDFVTNGNLGN